MHRQSSIACRSSTQASSACSARTAWGTILRYTASGGRVTEGLAHNTKRRSPVLRVGQEIGIEQGVETAERLISKPYGEPGGAPLGL